MSLYNMLHGVNPMATMLLGFLGITRDDVPRFRDAWVDEDRIAVHTRTGGGNRSWYDNAEGYMDETGEVGSGPWNDDLRALPGFLHDEDDDFDCTYATFYFEPQEDVASLVRQLSAIGSEKPAEKWQKLFSDMAEHRDSPRVTRALEAVAPIIAQITEAMTAQGIEAGTDETLQAAQPEGQEPGGVAMRPDYPYISGTPL